ncbi:MAG: Trp biosynthesis-associated membrane protein [Propionibacteriales bacterium]|nr:Trp biosynthesis-associated membrane protein [Propionibacteriales bacterium]
MKRTSFGPVLLAGLATAALETVAASRTWLHARVDGLGRTRSIDIAGSDGAPLALALALVALAAWGVILVSRLRARRIAAVIGLLATLGVVAVVVALWSDSERVALRVVADQGVGDLTSVGRSAWYWVTGLAALGQAALLATALRVAPSWPTMSSRYDAPAKGAETAGQAGPTEGSRTAEQLPDLELWKALDEGQDPTATGSP